MKRTHGFGMRKQSTKANLLAQKRNTKGKGDQGTKINSNEQLGHVGTNAKQTGSTRSLCFVV